MKKLPFHRNAPAIPTDPAERKAMVRWLQQHRLWNWPVPYQRNPNPTHSLLSEFVPSTGTNLLEWKSPEPQADWPWDEHLYGSWLECVEIDFVYVNPETERIEDDDTLNTAGRVWLEAGGWIDMSVGPGADNCVPPGGWTNWNKYQRCWNPSLDCGGQDMESALLSLAIRVKFYYGEGHTRLPDTPSQCDGTFEDNDSSKAYIPGCIPAEDGFCEKCGYRIRQKPSIHEILADRLGDE